MSGQARRRDHTFHGSAFDFTVWKQSSNGFDCPHIGSEQQYKLLCKYRWDTLIEELESYREPGAQCANGSVIVSSCIIAIEAIAIGVLMFYACRMRKKSLRAYQGCKIEGGDVSRN